MSGKGKEEFSKEVTTTPRRLRSGTQYGDHNNHIQMPVRKENKKSTKELNHAYDIDNDNKEHLSKASKNCSITCNEKFVKRCTSGTSASLSMGSPDQQEKGQTLKAILESIEPNICLKSKHSKRKSLRDLLDQKLNKNKIGSEQTDDCKEQRQYLKSEKRLVNGANHHHSKSYQRHSTKENRYDPDTEADIASRKNTMHTQTPAEASGLPKIKEELPDDYWAMKRIYAEKSATKTSPVEFRIKAGHSNHFDDRSQMFRISCSRPEIVDSSSLSSLPRNIKPDIVLKVRPRSASLSALTRAATDSNWSAGNTQTASRFHGRLVSHSKLYSTVSPLPVRSRACLQSDYNLNSLHDKDVRPLYRSASTNFIKPPENILEHICPNVQTNLSVRKCWELDQLEEQDLLEESKLPPVARTVELLSEPHDYHQDNDDAFRQNADYCTRLCRQHIHDSQRRRSADCLALGLMTFAKTYPYTDKEKYKRTNETRNCDSKDKDAHLWRKYGCSANARRKMALSPTQLTLEAESSLSAATAGDRQKEETEEDEEEEEDDDDSGWTDGSDKMSATKHVLKDRVQRSRDARDSHGTLKTVSDEHSSRRRGKGRPSRRAKTQRRWQTADLYLWPREEDEDDGEGESDPVTGSEKGRVDKPATRSAASELERGRKGTGKRQGELGGGTRKGRKALDMESLLANPELDNHAYLLWASENRSGLEKRKPDVRQGEVEDLLVAQWTQLPFSAKLHYLSRARDAGTDHNKHAVRKKKTAVEKKEMSPSEGRSVYEEFLRLPQERQKDLLRKWLRFFQKMLPRMEYQDFISDFKKACKNLSLRRPMPTRRKNARLRNLDPSHYHMLFEKIRETRPRVISVYNKRKAREEMLLSQSFNAMVRRLIMGHPWPFVRGCRSKILGELLKDIQQLEVEEVLAQIDFPLSLTSADFSNPYLTTKNFHDSDTLCPVETVSDPIPSDPVHCPPPVSQAANKDGHCRNGPNYNSTSSALPAVSRVGGPTGDGELPDNPVVLALLETLRHAVDLPLLDQWCLDSVFLAPPTRSRSQTARDTQFQNSATYRRTLLYKHIQPLLDARGMPLPSSALYHSHSAQYFYPDDR